MKIDSRLAYAFVILVFFFLIITFFIGEDNIIKSDSQMQKMTGTGAITIESLPAEKMQNETNETVQYEITE